MKRKTQQQVIIALAREAENLRKAIEDLDSVLAKLYATTIPEIEHRKSTSWVGLTVAKGHGGALRSIPCSPEIRTESEPPATPDLRIVRKSLK